MRPSVRKTAALRAWQSAGGALHDRVEHRLRVGLQLARSSAKPRSSRSAGRVLRQVLIARLKLCEQPHVLDRDDRLVGEGPQQFDLPIAEGVNIATPQTQKRRPPLPFEAGVHQGLCATQLPESRATHTWCQCGRRGIYRTTARVKIVRPPSGKSGLRRPSGTPRRTGLELLIRGAEMRQPTSDRRAVVAREEIRMRPRKGACRSRQWRRTPAAHRFETG